MRNKAWNSTKILTEFQLISSDESEKCIALISWRFFDEKTIFSTGDVSFPRFRILLISKLPCIPGWLDNEQTSMVGPWMRALNGGAMNAGGHEPVGPEFDPSWYQRLRQFLSSKTKIRTRAPQIMRRPLIHCAMVTCMKFRYIYQYISIYIYIYLYISIYIYIYL